MRIYICHIQIISICYVDVVKRETRVKVDEGTIHISRNAKINLFCTLLPYVTA